MCINREQQRRKKSFSYDERRGKRIVGVQMVREYVYIFGAVSPLDGCHDSLVLPRADSEAMSIFLKEVSLRHQEEHIVMFMDQAGWHTSKTLTIPPNIELAFLPPYSPELNPQEQIWDELREKFFVTEVHPEND